MRAPSLFCRATALTVVFLSSLPFAQAAAVVQRLRTIDVAKQNTDVYAVEVASAPKLTTNIRLPQGFVAADVLCGGACIDAADLAHGDTSAAANWVIEKRESQQSIHLWPARLPGPGNPISAFATNVYVATDDGKAYNITLKLIDLQAGEHAADAVVNIVNSAEAKGPARRIALQQQCREQAREELQQEARGQFFAGLNGAVSCKTIRWNRPHRDGLLVVRVRQLCRSKGAKPMLWAHYEIENRSAGPLQIDSVRLEPASESFQGTSDVAGHLSAQTVAGKRTVTGVAVRTFGSEPDGLRGWRLEVVPEPNASAGTVLVGDLHF